MDEIAFQKWKEFPLGHFISSVIDYRGKTPPNSNRGIPVISAANIKNGRVVLGTKHVSREVYEKWTTRGFVKPKDVLITTEAPVAEVAQLPGDQTYLITRRVIALQVDTSKGDENFMKYYLLSDIVKRELKKLSHGTTVPRLYKEDILNFQVRFPSLPIQRKIAAILSAYDDLIENNLRRIYILEEMAQTIYREWFIDLRFPGHEKVQMIDSPLGEIPNGWKVKKLGDVIELAYGRALKATDRIEGDVLVFGSGGVIGHHNVSLAKAPGIIVGRKGNVGSVYWSDQDFYPIDTVFYVKTHLSSYYVYYNLQTQNFINTDAAVPGLNRNQAYLLPFIVPTEAVLTKFEMIIRPIFSMIKILKNKNNNLCRTRDLLLPRLIAGTINVEELEITLRGRENE